jgi:hypothetical protein
MQNKGAILTFAILLAAVCLYQLTFTFQGWPDGASGQGVRPGRSGQGV